MSYRLIAQDIATGEFRNWDVPLADVQVTYALSGPNEITGTLEPEIPELNLAAYDAWSTWLHLEQDGYIRASGIIQPAALRGAALDVVATSHSGYAHGIPFLGDYSRIQIDPLDVVRDLWNHVQSYPDGDLDVAVDDTTSTVRIGTEERDVEFDTNAGEHVQFQTSLGPYKLNWWTHSDCGNEIDNLARQTPFDYRDESSWNPTRSDVTHRVRLGYPRLGRRLPEVRFIEGINIVDSVPLTELDDAYASEVIVTGAGEGRDTVRGTAADPDSPRLRRVAHLSDRSITEAERARALAYEELQRRKARVSMEEITVDTTHPNGPWGSFGCGDDVAVTGLFPWIGRTTIWHRITGITWSPTQTQARLRLIPSDSAYYGPPVQRSV